LESGEAIGTSLSTAQQTAIVENQALMDDNTTILPRGCACEHRSVNRMSLSWLPADYVEENHNVEKVPYDCGDN
jgi:hypothetical protein